MFEGLNNKESLEWAKFIRLYIAFLRQLNLYLNHFPRHEKYALSQRIRNKAYECFEFINEARKRYHKKTTLTNLDTAFEVLKLDLLLAYELGYFAFKDNKKTDKSPEDLATHRYAILQNLQSRIGVFIGAWLKSILKREGLRI